MYTDIIGTQQILITAAFLGVMILLLIILRKKSTVIRASMKAGKRINIIEDTAVSSTERLRLISIDSTNFIMVSAKGHAPSLVCLTNAGVKPMAQQVLSRNVVDESDDMKAALAGAMEAHAAAKPFVKSSIEHDPGAKVNLEMNADDKQQAFAEKFRSWRQQNEAR